MCSQREYAKKNEQAAMAAFQNAPDAQRADYIAKYRQFGPNAMLTDAIVLYALRKEMAARGIPEDDQGKAAWDEEAARKLCVAGFTLRQLSTLEAEMTELIAARYHNLLQKRTKENHD